MGPSELKRERKSQLFIVLLLILATIAMRIIWVLAVANYPGFDLESWRPAFATLLVKQDPYQYGTLNWPPFWMEVLYCIGKISLRFGLDFYAVLHTVLIAADVTVLLLTLALEWAVLWWKKSLQQRDQILRGALLMLSLFILGPAYGSQYWFWVVPLLLICYREYRGALRIALLVMGVAAASFIFDFLVLHPLGDLLYRWTGNELWQRIGDQLLKSPFNLALLRLPITLTAITVLIIGCRVWMGEYRATPSFERA